MNNLKWNPKCNSNNKKEKKKQKLLKWKMTSVSSQKEKRTIENRLEAHI
jgi:hypothetical protein